MNDHERQHPPAGWYPDPLHNQRERYWDGEAWEQAQEHASGLVPAGYLAAIFLPVIGFVIGVIAATRRDDDATRVHGPYIVIASIACAVLWASVLA